MNKNNYCYNCDGTDCLALHWMLGPVEVARHVGFGSHEDPAVLSVLQPVWVCGICGDMVTPDYAEDVRTYAVCHYRWHGGTKMQPLQNSALEYQQCWVRFWKFLAENPAVFRPGHLFCSPTLIEASAVLNSRGHGVLPAAVVGLGVLFVDQHGTHYHRSLCEYFFVPVGGPVVRGESILPAEGLVQDLHE